VQADLAKPGTPLSAPALGGPVGAAASPDLVVRTQGANRLLHGGKTYGIGRDPQSNIDGPILRLRPQLPTIAAAVAGAPQSAEPATILTSSPANTAPGYSKVPGDAGARHGFHRHPRCDLPGAHLDTAAPPRSAPPAVTRAASRQTAGRPLA
jgi:hypothetical protein